MFFALMKVSYRNHVIVAGHVVRVIPLVWLVGQDRKITLRIAILIDLNFGSSYAFGGKR